MVSLNELEVNKGHFESQAIIANIIVKYRNRVFNDENGILKVNDLTVISNDLQGQRSLNRMTFIYIPCNSYVMVHGRTWLLGFYFELFPHHNNCYQALTCACPEPSSSVPFCSKVLPGIKPDLCPSLPKLQYIIRRLSRPHTQFQSWILTAWPSSPRTGLTCTE